MQQYNSDELLNKLEDSTKKILNTVEQWRSLPGAAMQHQPVNNAWSALQCIGHLNKYGDYYLPAIEKELQKNALNNSESKVFKPGILGNYFTRLMQVDQKGLAPKKMKAFKEYITSNAEDSSKTMSHFIEQQYQLLKLLDKAKNVNLNKLKVPISISKFIRLKLGDVFMFVLAHNERHIEQAKRAIAHAGDIT